MKKRLLLLPIAMLAINGLTGCNATKAKQHITYGTYMETEITKIKFADLETKMEDKSENFLLAMYYGEDSHCSCWGTFKNVLNEYVATYNVRVYAIDRFSFDESKQEYADKWGLVLMERDEPGFYIIQEGKVAKRYKYNVDAKMFKNLDVFKQEIDSRILAPNMFYVDQEYLDNAIWTAKEELLVHYIWWFCPDCLYCGPHVIEPYFNRETANKKVYVIDIANLLFVDGVFDKTNANYVEFNRAHHMSAAGDETFGYLGGKVPTTQYWKNGELQDMNVYFNDVIEEVNGVWTVTDSYYTEERIANLHYLDGVQTKVIKGLTIDPSHIENSGWEKADAAKYHDPILKAFLNAYAK